MTTSDTVLAPPRLTAHTERIADSSDLLEHLGADGAAWLDGTQGFVTAGVAAAVEPGRAVPVLRAIDHDRGEAPDGIGPRAVGALPFEGSGRLVVPARVVTRAGDGRMWRTTIEPATRYSAAPGSPAAPASRYTIEQLTDFAAWHANVDTALALIGRGEAEKIVLAREVLIEANAPFDVRAVLEGLHRTQPGCVVYADGGFVGASPELLVRRDGDDIVARPMAGTGLDPRALAHSEKDAREHRLVVDAVCDALRPTCADIVAGVPAPVALTDFSHLATTITARLRDPEVSAADLALALHPTPAVAGTPRAAALAAITRLEPAPRGNYAGPCGWVDASGNGEFVVALRGAHLDGPRARLHAGAGIVAGSEAAAEWAETRAKLEPMLRVLVRV